MSTTTPTIEEIVAVLQTVRLSVAGLDERTIHTTLANTLRLAGYAVLTDHRLPGTRCILDLLVCDCDSNRAMRETGIAIEVKKRRPGRSATEEQLARYAAHRYVRGLVLVLEESMVFPETIVGKPLHVVSLNANWGIAL